MASPGPIHKPHDDDSDLELKNWNSEDPLWMSRLPDDVDENPAFAAIHGLIYGDATPDQVAANFKQQGNEQFKTGIAGYEHAGYWYSRALEHPGVADKELISQLYSNRAAVLVGLGNYGRALVDVSKALENDPRNLKAYYRGCQAAFSLFKYDLAMKYCDAALKIDSSNKSILNEKDKVTRALEAQMRRAEERKREQSEKARADIEIRRYFEKNRIKIGSPLSTRISEVLESSRIYIDSEGGLHLPVLFIYEEFHQADIIKDFNATQTFSAHLDVMFPEGSRLPWDREGRYNRDSIHIYVIMNQVPSSNSEPTDKSPRKVKVKSSSELSRVLQHPDYVMPGIPVFYLVDEKYNDIFLKADISLLGKLNR